MTKLPDQLFEFIWYDGTDRIEAVRAPMMPYGIDSEADLPPAD